jgi:hypothetical protein
MTVGTRKTAEIRQVSVVRIQDNTMSYVVSSRLFIEHGHTESHGRLGHVFCGLRAVLIS